jgi:hypothetical protein
MTKRSYDSTKYEYTPLDNAYNLKVSDSPNMMVDNETLHLHHFFNIFCVPPAWIEKKLKNLKIPKTSEFDLNQCNSQNISYVRGKITYKRNNVPIKLIFYHVTAASAGKWPKHPLEQCSHLCHNPHCYNPHHLIWELNTANNVRNACHSAKKCVCNNPVKCFPQK